MQINMERILKALFVAAIAFHLSGCGERAATDSLPDTLKVKRLSKTYVITGLGLSGSNKVAIINGVVLQPGVELDPGVVLKDVQPTYAVILLGNTEHRLRPENIQNELNQQKR